MISRSSCRLPLRLKRDAPTVHIPVSLPPIFSSTRHASTSETTTSAASTPQRTGRPIILRDTRIPTPQEVAYAKRKKAGGKKIRPIQIDIYTRRLMDTRLAAIKARIIRNRVVDEYKTEDNPIHGLPGSTPFIESLNLGMPSEKVFIPNEDGVPVSAPATIDTQLKEHAEILSSENTGVAKPDHLAHFLSSEELDRFGRLSAALSKPSISDKRSAIDPQAELKRQIQHEEDHATRMAALARITAVENLGSSARSRLNTRRMIDEFGRHNTDLTIDPRQNIKKPHHDDDWTPKQRIGPDTGSSEVQIALLTAKIKNLAAAYEGGAIHDKVNKRNLRLLLHRRQKMLAYFYKRDRGGERWQHMVKKLGITPAMWKGEIILK